MTAAKSERRAGYLFAMPWFFGFVVFMLYPVVASIYYSFCEFSVLKPPIFVGLENYRDLMSDSKFWVALWNTFYFTILSVPIGTAVAIGLALLLNAKVKGQAFYRTAFYLPALLPQVALAMLWMWIFNGERGILNAGLLKLGIHGPGWLSDPAWSKPAIIFMTVWTGGNAMVIYLAGLQDVPTELIEASELDGATPFHKLKNVTLPMISPIIMLNVILSIIGSFQIFVTPYIMFPGGVPDQSTYFYVSYLFDNAMIYHKMGYACAMGWIMFIIVLLLTLVSVKLSEKKVYYAGG